MNILNSGRYGMGAGAAGGLRRLIGGLALKFDFVILLLCAFCICFLV